MEGSGVKYLNVLGTRNLNSRICDPVSIGFLHHRNLDMCFEGFRRESMHFSFPTILEDKNEFMDMYYPHESLSASKENNSLFPKYGVVDLNMFLSIDFLKSTISANVADLFKFRLKKKKVQAMKKQIKSNLEGILDPLNGYSFEFNAFVLAKTTKNVKMLIRDAKEAVLYLGSEGQKGFSEQEMVSKMKEHADKYIEYVTGDSASKRAG
jgi:hypothetical protein